MGEDLQLVAIYGFARSVSVILFGAAVGNWVDRSQRLTSAKFFLGTQVRGILVRMYIHTGHGHDITLFKNLLLILDCLLLAVFFWQRPWFEENMGGPETATTVMSAIVIFIATLANLASVGSKIVIEKDWIVVVSEDDQERLAQMNAVFRTLDLVRGKLYFDGQIRNVHTSR